MISDGCRAVFNYLTGLLLGNARVLQLSGVVDIAGIQRMARQDVFVVGEKFKNQLLGIFAQGHLPETHAPHIGAYLQGLQLVPG